MNNKTGQQTWKGILQSNYKMHINKLKKQFKAKQHKTKFSYKRVIQRTEKQREKKPRIG